MRGINRRGRRVGAAIGLSIVAVTATAFGIASGAVPGTDGVIHGCIKKDSKHSSLHINDDALGGRCMSDEVALDFNQKGVKGNKGTTGATGPSGAAGATGATGGTGPAGTAGPAGAPGAQGPAGQASPPRMTFASGQGYAFNYQFEKIISKTLPAGSWGMAVSVQFDGPYVASGEATTREATCELRSGATVLATAVDRAYTPGDRARAVLTMNAGSAVPAGGEVSVWCQYEAVPLGAFTGQMTITEGAFF